MATIDIAEVLRLLEVFLRLFAYFFQDQAQVEDNVKYDFVIVGGGSAGCVLAGRLSEDPSVSVLLIEAGDNPTLEVMLPGLASYNQFSKFDWNYTSVDDGSAYQCYLGNVFQTERGHGLGGSSSVNYMLHVRGDPHDYNQWAKIVNSSTWNYDHVLPYFKKSERLEDAHVLASSYKSFHGTTGPMGITRHSHPGLVKYLNVFKELGYNTVLDTNGNNTLAFGFPMYAISKGLRQSSCFCFVSPVRNRTNLHVLRNTKVNKVLIENKVAIGVQVVTADNVTLTIKANLEVILSAGAFNTPQILMLSGIGPKEHLESFNITTIKDLPVGYNLQDHVSALVLHQITTLNSSNTFTNPFAPQETYINGFIALDKSQTYPDAQFLLLSTNSTPGILGLFGGFKSDIYNIGINAGKGIEVALNFIINLHPKSRGRVMLRSANPNDPPKIYLGAYSNQTDLNNMVKYINEYLLIENSTYFKSVNASRLDLPGDRCNNYTLGSSDYWKCYSQCLMVSVFHYSCTCPMGTVVSSRLRVLGIKKLRVVDASVFPLIPSGNINAPTIMVAEKAADMIKTDHSLIVSSLTEDDDEDDEDDEEESDDE